MKKVFLLMNIVLIACVAFTSCHEHELAEVIETSPTQPEIKFTEAELKLMETMNGDHKIKIADARRLALDAINSNRRQMRGTKFMGMRKNVDYEVVQESDLEEEIILCAPEISVDEELQALDIKDTIAYAFREREGGGFMLIAADDRLEDPVLACIDNSDAFQSDSITNDIESFILDQLSAYYVSEIMRYNELTDSLETSINEKIEELIEAEELEGEEEPAIPPLNSPRKIFWGFSYNVTKTPLSNWTIIGSVNPLISTKWGQREPYNDAVKHKNGKGNARTGCVATAVAQLMAYWKFPAQVGGMNIDWNHLTSNSQVRPYDYLGRQHVAHLMKTIGENVNMKYKENSSSAKTKDGRNWMKKIGYVNGREYNYNFNRVVESLNAGCPVLARGDRTFKYIKIFGKKIGYTKNGHAWIIDGYVSKERQMKQTLEIVYRNKILYSKTSYYKEEQKFLACNWGWYGENDGWFPAGCFDALTGGVNENTVYSYSSMKKINSTELDEDDGTANNYQYNKEIFVNLKPNNL